MWVKVQKSIKINTLNLVFSFLKKLSKCKNDTSMFKNFFVLIPILIIIRSRPLARNISKREYHILKTDRGIIEKFLSKSKITLLIFKFFSEKLWCILVLFNVKISCLKKCLIWRNCVPWETNFIVVGFSLWNWQVKTIFDKNRRDIINMVKVS